MKVYRTAYVGSDDGPVPGEHLGFSFCALKRVADDELVRLNKNSDVEASLETIEFKPTRAGIVALLNRIASHPDNG